MKKKTKFIPALKQILNYSKGFKLSFILVILFSILSAVFSVLTPYMLGNITTSIFNSVKKHIPLNYSYIYKTLIILGVLYIIYSIFNYLKSYISTRLGLNVSYKLRKDLINKMSKLEIKELDKHEKGDLISIVVNDVEKINDFFTDDLPELAYHLVLMVGILIMIIYISIRLSIISFLSIPVTLIILGKVVGKTEKYFDKNREYLGKVNSNLEESIYNDLIIKSYNKEEYFESKFDNENSKLKEYSFKSTLYASLAHPVINFINNLNYALVILFGAFLVIKGKMKIGQIQAFSVYINNFFRPITMLAQILSALETTAAASNRVFNILDAKEEVSGKLKIKNNPNLIEFKDVYFSYDKEKEVLKGIDFTIEKGTQVAIVGETGSGKTTIINLLMAFYRVNKGNILIDGIDINEISKEEIRDKFSLVLQEPWIWNASIKENITFNDEYSERLINKTLEEANLNHIVKSLPGGINFEVNETSDNVSVGEKQLITIARAILNNKDVLILDEATSGVDVRTEYLINNSLKTLMKGKTKIVIAHRLSTITNSDKIVVIDKGKIKEVGTHTELLKQKGYYYKLYSTGFSEE